MSVKVVKFKDTPLLNDIPGLLRLLADRIEKKEDGHENTDSVTIIIPQANDYPAVFGFGDMSGLRDPVIVCEMAKAWLIKSHVGESL